MKQAMDTCCEQPILNLPQQNWKNACIKKIPGIWPFCEHQKCLPSIHITIIAWYRPGCRLCLWRLGCRFRNHWSTRSHWFPGTCQPSREPKQPLPLERWVYIGRKMEGQSVVNELKMAIWLIYAVGPKTVRVVVPIFIIRTSSYVDTQSYHHRHFITQSSCHHHAISNLRISSYVDRDTQGGYGWVGGWVGGGDDNIQYDVHHATLSSPSYHHAIIMQSLIYAFHHTLTEIRGGWVGGWVGGIITCTFVCGNGATGTQVSMLHCWLWQPKLCQRNATSQTLQAKEQNCDILGGRNPHETQFSIKRQSKKQVFWDYKNTEFIGKNNVFSTPHCKYVKKQWCAL